MTGHPGTPVRVASYNTRDFLDDRQAAARVVRAIGPDILCLQEVPRRLCAAHRIRRFAATCGMSWPGAHRGSGGTTIFVSDRVRVEVARHHRLSVAILMRTRGYALARLSVDGGRPLTVGSIHLSLRAGERRVHMRTVRDSLLDLAGDEGRIVVAGDLNEAHTGQAWQLLTSRLVPVSPEAPTYPARRPRSRLDVVFATPDLTVLPHRRAELPEEDLLAASDHRPVWVDLLA